MRKSKNTWSSQLAFIISSAGAAIGIGAIWKFPYMAGQFGGGLFLLSFLLFTFLIGVPLLISEFIIGRASGKNAVKAYDTLSPTPFWKITGRLGVVGCFLLLSFYSVVGGWILIYSYLGVTNNIISQNNNYETLFNDIIGNSYIVLLGVVIFIILNMVVLYFGVKKGIEKVSKVLFPAMLMIFIILVVKALTLSDAGKGLEFFFGIHPEKFSTEGLLYALGQSFFSLAVGFSCMVTYSSYLSKKENIPRAAVSVATMNIIVSILAGVTIFPIVYSFNFEPTAGPGLLFIVLPSIFSKMAFGSLFLAAFLLLFLFATLTSSFSLFEVIIAAFNPRDKGRGKIVFIIGLIVFLSTIPASLSFGTLSHVTVAGKSIFDATDYLVSNILLLIGCLLISLFVSFRMDKAMILEEFTNNHTKSMIYFKIWKFLVRYIVPVLIIIVMLFSL